MKVKQKQVNQETNQIEQAVKVLQQGGVIAYPTEAVYGLGCDPNNISAVKKILQVKQREKEKGLILVAANFDQVKPFLKKLEAETEEKLLRSWRESDHAITWLVPVKEDVSEYLRGQYDSLAVRVTRHPLVKDLCEKYGGAIVSTSANRSTEEAARTSKQVKQIFNNEIDLVIEGETNPNANPSEIRDALTGQVIRAS
jgi:L-threonylcarbamoyladenylate synthase